MALYVNGRKKRFYQPRVNPIDRFDDDLFQKRYRLPKYKVVELAELYRFSGFCSTSDLDRRGMGLGAQERMCLALRYFATGCNYSIVGDFQGVGKGTVSKILHEVLRFFESRLNHYIKWPMTFEEMLEKAHVFYDRHGGKPYCLGCIDGTHIPIVAPREREVDYVNRKGYHSINAMVVVDAERRINFVNARFPGSVHDSFVLQQSGLQQMINAGLLGNFYLLGDSGYPLRHYLLTPISRPSNEEETEYNLWHMSTRALVEQAIGVLKQRFRCLDGHGGFLYHKPADCARIINACVCLHNICIDLRVAVPEVDDEVLQRRRPNYAAPLAQPPPGPPQDQGTQEGRARRNNLMRYYFRN